jgi:uncharacterized protein (DUF1697 family)
MAQGWVAFLRGVNLGARNKVPMEHLRKRLVAAGYDDVQTYIQSGNVLFTKQAKDRAALARKLERTIEDEFGVTSRVALRTFDELRKIALDQGMRTLLQDALEKMFAGVVDYKQARAIAVK